MDVLGNMLTMIRNAGNAGKSTVVVPESKFKKSVLKTLLDLGYIKSYKSVKDSNSKPAISIELKYKENGAPAVTGTRLVSKKSRRIYSNVKGLYPVREGFGDLIVSTPKGVMDGKTAIKNHVGGEVLFEIW